MGGEHELHFHNNGCDCHYYQEYNITESPKHPNFLLLWEKICYEIIDFFLEHMHNYPKFKEHVNRTGYEIDTEEVFLNCPGLTLLKDDPSKIHMYWDDRWNPEEICLFYHDMAKLLMMAFPGQLILTDVLFAENINVNGKVTIWAAVDIMKIPYQNSNTIIYKQKEDQLINIRTYPHYYYVELLLFLLNLVALLYHMNY